MKFGATCKRLGSKECLSLLIVFVAVATTTACSRANSPPVWEIPGGDAHRGKQWIQQLGCSGCHLIPGVRVARGNVGPPLTQFGDRSFIAGMLRNTPENLVKWIREPQTVVPGNAMPDVGASEAQARDIAAYLYTLH